MEYKITKIQLIQTAMPGGLREWFYLANVRVYPDSSHKSFYRRRFVFMFDADDLAENFAVENPDTRITQAMIKEYKNEVAWAMAESLIASNKDIAQVTMECNDTIHRYNTTFCGC